MEGDGKAFPARGHERVQGWSGAVRWGQLRGLGGLRGNQQT